MGTWGPAIMSNDYAEDIKESWKVKIGNGETPEHATKQIISEYDIPSEFSNTEDEYNFWLSLALVQWKTGRLIEGVKSKALRLLSEEVIAEIETDRWESNSDYKKRIGHLKKLEKTLHSPQPKAKRITKPFSRKSTLNSGDIISIQLKSAEYIVLEIVAIEIDREDQIPRAILLNYLSKEVPTKDSVEGLKPLTLRKIYNSKNIEMVNGERKVEYVDIFQNQFTLWATSKRYDEPKERIIFISTNRISKYKKNTDAIWLNWKDIDEEPLKWLNGDIAIHRFEKDV